MFLKVDQIHNLNFETYGAEDGYVLTQAELIKASTTIIHGTHDYLCPINEAELLRSKITDSKLIICDAGHSASELEIEHALKEATSNYS